MHGSATKAARAKAQDRINAAADSAARHLIDWMGDKKVPYNIRLQAARDLLDRCLEAAVPGWHAPGPDHDHAHDPLHPKTVQPAELADVVVENTDPTAPVMRRKPR